MLSKTLTESVVLAQPGSVVMISMAHIATKGHKTTHPPRPLDYYLWLESEGNVSGGTMPTSVTCVVTCGLGVILA